jgi:electron transfer flavoprotein alpha subunit
MSKLNEVWVVAESEAAAIELTAGALTLGDKAVLVYAGDASVPSSASIVYYFDTSQESFLGFAPAIAELVLEKKPDLVLAEGSKNCRFAAGVIAAKAGVGVHADLSEIWTEDGAVFSKRMVYGGAAFKTEKSVGLSVACVGLGVFEATTGAPAGEAVALAPTSGAVRFIERQSKKEQSVNLAAAKKVIGVGRGIGSLENLELARGLAGAMKAEMGCTRPISEEEKWMPKSAYIGVSGVICKPDTYLGLGTSGQIQHMVGVNQAGLIFAIDKDKNAPIFKQCDYGLVADLGAVLAPLTAKLGS